MKKQEKSRVGDKIRRVLCFGSFLVQYGDKNTLHDMWSGMQCIKVGKIGPGLFRNLMDVVGHSEIRVFISLF